MPKIIDENKKKCNYYYPNNEHLQKRLNNLESKTLIVHLPIDLTNDSYNYQQTIDTHPKNNNSIFDNTFNLTPSTFCALTNENNNNNNNNVNNTENIPPNTEYYFIEDTKFEKNINKLISTKYYHDSNANNNKISLHCWHCCMEIKHKPKGIPIKFENKKFYVKGFFCSYNCALTFNYNTGQNASIIQERESLIRMLSSNNDLQYAPSKETLKMFGGTLTHEEFHKHSKFVDIVYYPMMPVISFVEENLPVSTQNSLNNKLQLFVRN